MTAISTRTGFLGKSIVAIAACLLAGLSGCVTDEMTIEDAPEVATEQSALRLYVLDCGSLTLPDVSMFNVSLEEIGLEPGELAEMFVPCYLIDHPEGRLLWDLGLPLTVRSGDYGMEGAELTLESSVVEQLAELELSPGDIDYVAMSHLHFDHCGQANDFSSSHHLIQRAEYESAFADPPTFPIFQRDLYAGLEESETTVLDGEHDLFGDGKVVLKPAPGHTPGHQILFVDLAETGPIVLSGDLYHFPANRSLRRPPLFNVDAEMTLEAMEATEALLERTGATLWIEHDAALAATLDKLPAFYR